MEAILGYSVIGIIAVVLTMPMAALAVTAHRNKQSNKRLEAVMMNAILEAQKNKKNA
tara:strand:- start:5692 stop:5862 length:171 start_codon:yes stop_codon:yes gene_type:complete